MTDKTQKSLKYKGIPKQVSRKDFNHYIKPISRKASKVLNRNCLSIRYSTISSMFYIRVFNGINSEHCVMNFIGLTSKWHNRWSKDGSYDKLFEASIIHLQDADLLDTTQLHGDGSNTVVKKEETAHDYKVHFIQFNMLNNKLAHWTQWKNNRDQPNLGTKRVST